MKNVLIVVLVLLALIFGYLVLRSKTDDIASSNVPTTNGSAITLPSSFTINIQGYFANSSYGVYLTSSGDNELTGTANYYKSIPAADGFTQECTLKDGEWLESSTSHECPFPTTELATTRIGLTEQIVTGQLKPVLFSAGEKCEDNKWCYELK